MDRGVGVSGIGSVRVVLIPILILISIDDVVDDVDGREAVMTDGMDDDDDDDRRGIGIQTKIRRTRMRR
jgi:hypothetical protein